jgi:protein arginine N-methyltransferase 1
VERKAAVNSLVAWFTAELADGVSLTNAPDAPDTHWGQLLLPLSRERVVDAGATISAQVACIPAGHARSHLAWSVRIGGEAWEHHDTRAGGLHGAPVALA